MTGPTAFILSHLDRRRVVAEALGSALKVVGAERGFVQIRETGVGLFVSLDRAGKEPPAEAFGGALDLVSEIGSGSEAISRGSGVALPLVLSVPVRGGECDRPGELLGVLYLERGPGAEPFTPATSSAFASAAGSFATLIACMLVSLETHTDRLSGLLTRQFFFRLLPEEIRTAAADNRPLALLMLDVRHLEAVNRAAGRGKGDEVLQLLARLLREAIRTLDFAARLGGDEFLAALPGCAEQEAVAIAGRLKERFESEVARVRLPAAAFNGGIAVFPSHGTEAGALLRRADQALAAAKRLGAGRVVSWQDEHRDVRERVDRLEDLLTGDPAEDYSRILTLLDTISEISSIADSTSLLQRLMDRMIDAADAERALLLRPGPAGDMQVALTRDRSRTEVEISRARYSRRVVERALLESRPFCATWGGDDASRSFRSLRLHTAIALPLTTPDGGIGLIYLDSREQTSRYTVPTLAYLGSLAHVAALVVQRAAMAEELDRRQQEIEVASRRLRTMTEAPGRSPAPREEAAAVEPVLPGGGPMREILAMIRTAAATDAPVLLSGETGSGKEVAAREVHRLSRRAARPFVAVNCAAIPHALIEAELFGHARGAFTGAERDRAGLFEQAHGGTLFLDEIASTDLAFQAKLLRALQEGAIRRLGEATDRSVDARVIAATNVDLLAAIREHQFRDDLYYRLAVFTIHVPPLRERPEDIALLAGAFLREACGRTGQTAPDIKSGAMALLTRHAWPGNVRELRNVMERLAACASGSITEASLRAVLHVTEASPATAAPRPSASRASDLFDQILSTGRSFWEVARDPFLKRELTREDLRDLVAMGLSRAGSYKKTAELFNIPAQDYKKFLDFLHNHELRSVSRLAGRAGED